MDISLTEGRGQVTLVQIPDDGIITNIQVNSGDIIAMTCNITLEDTKDNNDEMVVVWKKQNDTISVGDALTSFKYHERVNDIVYYSYILSPLSQALFLSIYYPRPPETFSVTRPPKGEVGLLQPPPWVFYINYPIPYVCNQCIAMSLLFLLIPKKYDTSSYDITMTS